MLSYRDKRKLMNKKNNKWDTSALIFGSNFMGDDTPRNATTSKMYVSWRTT